MKFGPPYGYFPKPGKSYYICKAEDEPTARQAFESFGLKINYSRGQGYLGCFIGSTLRKEEWLGELVSKWVSAMKTLSVFPHKMKNVTRAINCSYSNKLWFLRSNKCAISVFYYYFLIQYLNLPVVSCSKCMYVIYCL